MGQEVVFCVQIGIVSTVTILCQRRGFQKRKVALVTAREMCRWGCAGVNSTFMCKWCGTRYCRECLHGEFNGSMRDSTQCAKCNQKKCQGQKVETVLKQYLTDDKAKKGSGSSSSRSRSASPAKRSKSSSSVGGKKVKSKSGGKKGGKKKKKKK